MFTNKRLNQAYSSSKRQYFDSTSKYVFMSDSHRGDDSLSDEFTKNKSICLHALNYYYNKGFTYVEAGDGDELWEHSSFKTIRLAHRDIFKSLKRFYYSNRLIMLYGNHNIFLKNPHYVKKNLYQYYSEFDEKHYKLFYGIKVYPGLILKHRKTKQEIFIVHGHQGDLMNDQGWVLSMIMLRYFWRFMHIVGFQNPSSPAKSIHKRHKVEAAYNKWIEKNQKKLICGHTHRPKFSKTDELPYFNTGCCIRSDGISCIEIENDQIISVDWVIRPDKKGLLKVERKIMRGPEDLSSYRF